MKKDQIVWGLLRLFMGWTFFWAFLDKVFGLGFATTAEKAWIQGGSPTAGFLTYGTKGPFAELFQSLAGQGWVDWMFMLGLLFIGASLLLGIFVRSASVAGIVLSSLMYLAAALPPEHNPVLDEHILYIILFVGFIVVPVGEWLGLGKKWKETSWGKQGYLR